MPRYLITSFIVLITLSCNNTNQKEPESSTKIPEEPKCGCSWTDVDKFIRSIVNKYNLQQNLLPTEHAERLTVSHIPNLPRPDCSYMVKIKVEDLNSGLGLSEPQYIEKRVKCDGVEVYMD